MAGNYPDGVTGNEWQIRGMDEGVANMKCEAQAALQVFPVGERWVLTTIGEKIKILREKEQERDKGSNLYKLEEIDATRKSIVNSLEKLIGYLEEYDEDQLIAHTDECLFEGEVDIQYGDGVMFWECPICGTEHEDEIDMTPDDPRI